MLRELIIQNGLPLVFANVLLKSLGLPLPALPTLVLTSAIAVSASIGSAGFAAFSPGVSSLFPASAFPAFGPLAAIVVVATLAALIGDTLWFWLGHRYGSRVLGLLCRLSISRDTCVSRSLGFFGRFGVRILALSKFIPGLSTLAIPVAGATGFGSFLFL